MAVGDSRLSNTARLLAAQEFNRRALAEKAAKKLAKIEAERREEEDKRFRRQRELLAKQSANQSANIIAFQKKRLEDDIAKQKATAKEKARVAELNRKALEAKRKAIAKVVGGTGTNIETLSGRVTIKDSSGKITGLSNVESKTATRAKTLILKEILRREEERKKVTDLERFLVNEQALARGQVSRSALLKQIADRKARGLSKTPQQKAALARSTAFGTAVALAKRAGRKPPSLREFSATPKGKAKERELSRAKFSSNFGNVQSGRFISVKGAGASFQARSKDSSLGQISSQLAFLQKRRTSKSASQSRNERVAQQIASGNFFSNLSTGQLSGIIGGGFSGKAQSAKSFKKSGARKISNKQLGARGIAIRQASPFAIIAQQDIPDPVTGITDRQVQLFREDLRSQGKPVPDTSSFFSSGRAPRSNDPFSGGGLDPAFAFGNFGGVDTTKLDEEGGDITNPLAVDDSLLSNRGAFFSDTQTQSDIDSARNEAVGVFGLPSGVRVVGKKEQEKRKKREKGLRAQGIDPNLFRGVSGTSIVSAQPRKVRALRVSETRQFGSLNLPVAESQRQADLGIPFVQSAFAETGGFQQGQQTKSTKGKGRTTKPQPPRQNKNIFDLGNLINENISGVGESIRGGVSGAVSGIDNIFANPTRESNAPLPSISDALGFGGGNSGNIFDLNIQGVSNRDVARESVGFLTNPFR